MHIHHVKQELSMLTYALRHMQCTARPCSHNIKKGDSAAVLQQQHKTDKQAVSQSTRQAFKGSRED